MNQQETQEASTRKNGGCPFCSRFYSDAPIETEEHFWEVCDEHRTKWATVHFGFNYGPFYMEAWDNYNRAWERLEAYFQVCGYCPPSPEPLELLSPEASCSECHHPLCPACCQPFWPIRKPLPSKPGPISETRPRKVQ